MDEWPGQTLTVDGGEHFHGIGRRHTSIYKKVSSLNPPVHCNAFFQGRDDTEDNAEPFEA